MTLVQLTTSEIEPVSLVDAKAHLRVDTSDEDLVIQALVAAARERVESITNRAIIATTYRLELACWPASEVITLPRPPLVSVDSVKYIDAVGALQTLDAAAYQVVTPTGPRAERATVRPAYGLSWPSHRDQPNAVQVTFTAGYGSSCPAVVKAAILLLVTHLYEHRGDSADGFPGAVSALLAPYVSRGVRA